MNHTGTNNSIKVYRYRYIYQGFSFSANVPDAIDLRTYHDPGRRGLTLSVRPATSAVDKNKRNVDPDPKFFALNGSVSRVM